VLLESLTLEDRYRGHGLGPPALAAIIYHLGVGYSLAALEPFPIGEPLDGKSRGEAIRALAARWEKVGFTKFTDAVWVLDLSASGFDEHFRALFPPVD
jgi:hypothetical protein